MYIKANQTVSSTLTPEFPIIFLNKNKDEKEHKIHDVGEEIKIFYNRRFA